MADTAHFSLDFLGRDHPLPTFLRSLATLCMVPYLHHWPAGPDGYPESFYTLIDNAKELFSRQSWVNDLERTGLSATMFSARDNRHFFVVKGTGFDNDKLSHSIWMLFRYWKTPLILTAYERFVDLAQKEQNSEAQFILSGHSLGGHVVFVMMAMLYAKEPELFTRCRVVAFDPPGAREAMQSCLNDLLPGDTDVHKDFFTKLKDMGHIVVGHPNRINRLNKQPLPVWCLTGNYGKDLQDRSQLTGEEFWQKRDNNINSGSAHDLGNIIAGIHQLAATFEKTGKAAWQSWTARARHWGDGDMLPLARSFLPKASCKIALLHEWTVVTLGMFPTRNILRTARLRIYRCKRKGFMGDEAKALQDNLKNHVDWLKEQKGLEEKVKITQRQVRRWLEKRRFVSGQFGVDRRQSLEGQVIKHGKGNRRSSKVDWQTEALVQHSRWGAVCVTALGLAFAAVIGYEQAGLINLLPVLISVTLWLGLSGFLTWAGFTPAGENFIHSVASHGFQDHPEPHVDLNTELGDRHDRCPEERPFLGP